MRYILFVILFTGFISGAGAQTSFVINESSVVKDTSGTVYPYEIWKKLLQSNYYVLKAENPSDKNTAFVLVRMTEEQRAAKLQSLPKPKESKYFKTGEAITSFSTTDINGDKYKLKDLKGKIVVLNFWFTSCKPCMDEIPQLNKLVESFSDSTDVVFLALALDTKPELKDFLKKTRFDYKILDNAKFIADQYKINTYPTHVVIDREGKVNFHTTGLGSGTVYWLEKSIRELLQATH